MIHFEFVFLKLVTLSLGLLVAYAAYRGSRRYHNRPLLYVAVGFAFIGTGAGLEGLLFHFTALSLYWASLIHTGFMAIGMAWILYSIYGGSTPQSGPVDERNQAW